MKIGQNGLVAGIRSQIFISLRKERLTKNVYLPSLRMKVPDHVQGGREVTVHPDNTYLRLNISLHSTAQHAVQCKMVGWQQYAR
jgi:hypothetical protein